MSAESQVIAPVSIAGAGNALTTHDAVGPRVLELCEGRYGAAAELCHIGVTGLALLDHLRGQPLLIVVDACIFGGPPGEIVRMEPDLEQESGRPTSVHQVGPLEALTVAKHLYPERLPQRVLLLLVETNGLDHETQEKACRALLPILDDEVWSIAGGQRTSSAGAVSACAGERS